MASIRREQETEIDNRAEPLAWGDKTLTCHPEQSEGSKG
jgi:hypothetical protein